MKSRALVAEWTREPLFSRTVFTGCGTALNPVFRNSLLIIIQRPLTSGLTKITNTLCGVESTVYILGQYTLSFSYVVVH